MKIEYISSADWGVEHTDDERDAYEQAVLEALTRAYPDAEIIVSTGDSNDSHAFVDGDRRSDEARTVCGIAQEVWDRAEFWPWQEGGALRA